MRAHRQGVDDDLLGVDLGALLQPAGDLQNRALVVAVIELGPADVAHALAGPVDHQHVHAAEMRLDDARVRIHLLGHVAAGDEDDARRLRRPRQDVKVALKLDALEGDLDPLQRIGCESDHLFVVGDAAAVQVALFVGRLEHRMLCRGEQVAEAR